MVTAEKNDAFPGCYCGTCNKNYSMHMHTLVASGTCNKNYS
jgi:hypothetical protein